MRLALREQAADEAPAVFRGRREAQLVAGLGVAVLAVDELRRIDELAVVVVEIRAVAGSSVS